eukprot:3136024-Pyramimonas_sp.AAC.1
MGFQRVVAAMRQAGREACTRTEKYRKRGCNLRALGARCIGDASQHLAVEACGALGSAFVHRNSSRDVVGSVAALAQA